MQCTGIVLTIQDYNTWTHKHHDAIQVQTMPVTYSTVNVQDQSVIFVAGVMVHAPDRRHVVATYNIVIATYQ